MGGRGVDDPNIGRFVLGCIEADSIQSNNVVRNKMFSLLLHRTEAFSFRSRGVRNAERSAKKMMQDRIRGR